MGTKQLKGIAHDLADCFLGDPFNAGALFEIGSLYKRDKLTRVKINLLTQEITPNLDYRSLRVIVAKYNKWFIGQLKKLKIDENKLSDVIITIKPFVRNELVRVKKEFKVVEEFRDQFLYSVEVKIITLKGKKYCFEVERSNVV